MLLLRLWKQIIAYLYHKPLTIIINFVYVTKKQKALTVILLHVHFMAAISVVIIKIYLWIVDE